MKPTLREKPNAGLKKKKLSTKARALEPVKGSGSDGLGARGWINRILFLPRVTAEYYFSDQSISSWSGTPTEFSNSSRERASGSLSNRATT
jgi:hypothetical protein